MQASKPIVIAFVRAMFLCFALAVSAASSLAGESASERSESIIDMSLDVMFNDRGPPPGVWDVFQDTVDEALGIPIELRSPAEWFALAADAEHEDAHEKALEILARVGRMPNASSFEAIEALAAYGKLSERIKKIDQAITAYDEIGARFANVSRPDLREKVAEALLQRARISPSAEAEIDGFDEVVKLFRGDRDPTVIDKVANALLGKANTLSREDKVQQAIDALDDAIQLTSGAAPERFKEFEGAALLFKARLLDYGAHPDEAVQVFDDVIGRFRDSAEARLNEFARLAVVDKGMTWIRAGKLHEAIALYDDFLTFRGSPDWGERHLMAVAYVNRATAHYQLGEFEKAIFGLDDMVDWLGPGSLTEAGGPIANGLFFKAKIL